jgi:hypothetical protein
VKEREGEERYRNVDSRRAGRIMEGGIRMME